MPTSGYRAPTDVERVLEGQTFKGPSSRGVVAPAPIAGGAAAASPGFKL
jgi:hypothetical protein